MANSLCLADVVDQPLANLLGAVLGAALDLNLGSAHIGIEGVDYFSCKASKTSDYTFKELAQDIAYSTTCTKADAMAVLEVSNLMCRLHCSVADA